MRWEGRCPQREQDFCFKVPVLLYSISALMECLLSNQITWLELTVVFNMLGSLEAIFYNQNGTQIVLLTFTLLVQFKKKKKAMCLSFVVFSVQVEVSLSVLISKQTITVWGGGRGGGLTRILLTFPGWRPDTLPMDGELQTQKPITAGTLDSWSDFPKKQKDPQMIGHCWGNSLGNKADEGKRRLSECEVSQVVSGCWLVFRLVIKVG